MSLEKVRSKYSRRKSHYFYGYIWCRPHCWCTGYHFGLVKLEVKSKTSSGVEFTAGGNTTTDGGKVWNVSNTLSYLTVLSRLQALWRPSTRSRSTGSPSLRNGQQITGNLPGNHLSKFFRTLTPLRCLFSILNPLNSTEIFVFSLNTTVDYEKLVPGLKLTLDSSFKPDTGAKVGRFLHILESWLCSFVFLPHLVLLVWQVEGGLQAWEVGLRSRHEPLQVCLFVLHEILTWNVSTQLSSCQYLRFCRARSLCSGLSDCLRRRYIDLLISRSNVS